MSTTRSLTIGRLPIAEMTGTRPASAMSYIRVLQARTAAPSMRIPRLQHARREVEAVAELDRLGQVGVEEVALVLHDDTLGVALAEALDDLDLLLHLVAVAEDTEVLEHRRAEVVADLEGPLAVL